MSQFLRPYVAEMQKYTHAPEIYHRACALTVFGSLLTRTRYRVVLDYGAPPIWTNLWTILIGDSGGAKTTAINMAVNALNYVEAKKLSSHGSILAPDEMTPEAFLDRLERRHTTVNDPSYLFVQRELLHLLVQFQRQYSMGLKSLFMDLYDVPEKFERALRKASVRIEKPRLSILGGVATDLLPKFTGPEDWLGGWFSRCMLIDGAVKKEREDLPQGWKGPNEQIAEQLRQALRIWRKTLLKGRYPTIGFSKDAEKALRELPAAPPEMHLRISLNRAKAHLVKIAAIEQVDENPEVSEIQKPAVLRALEYVSHWRKTIPAVLEVCCGNSREDFEGDRLPRRIIRYVQKNGGRVKKSQLLRNMSLDAKHLGDALTSLQDAELIRMEADPDTGAYWVESTEPAP